MLADNDLCSLRWDPGSATVTIIDQTLLPHTLRWCRLDSLEDFCHAISSMQVRGAPLIGITAAFGLAHALALDPSLESAPGQYCWRRAPLRLTCSGHCSRLWQK